MAKRRTDSLVVDREPGLSFLMAARAYRSFTSDPSISELDCDFAWQGVEIVHEELVCNLKRSDIVDRALQLLSFDDKQEYDCRSTVAHCILDIIDTFSREYNWTPTIQNRKVIRWTSAGKSAEKTTEDRLELEKISRNLYRVGKAIDRLSQSAAMELLYHTLKDFKITPENARLSVMRDTFSRIVLQLTKRAEYLEARSVKKGAKPPELTKTFAAMHAHNLMIEFSQKPPRQSSLYYELAGVLYEAATGVVDADLSRFCKKVLKSD